MGLVAILTTPKCQLDLLSAILACTETQPHSQTRQLLKNDPLEALLLQETLKGRHLIRNLINGDGAGQIMVWGPDDHEIVYQRLYYRAYDYRLEVKIGVIQNPHNDSIELHVQGTPESINRYSGGLLDPYMQEVENRSCPSNAYRRVIAHGCKMITLDDVCLLKKQPEAILHHLESVSLYLFHDYVVKDVNQSIHTVLLGKDFTMLTGDKMTSAVEIGQTIDLIKGSHFRSIESLEDLDDNTCDDVCYLINGRLLEDMIASEHTHLFARVIQNSRKRIIYRASPNGKQVFHCFFTIDGT